MSPNKFLVLVALASVGLSPSGYGGDTTQTDEARGKYLIVIGGCNDCHTAGFAPSGGVTPEAQWLGWVIEGHGEPPILLTFGNISKVLLKTNGYPGQKF